MSEFNFVAYYNALLTIVSGTESPLYSKYRNLKLLVERICKDEMNMVDLQTTDLSARISFMADRFGLSYREQQRLHTFRLTANAILNGESSGEEESLLRDVKSIAFFIKKVCGEQIPDELYALLPQQDAVYRITPLGDKQIKQMRVCFQSADENYLYVIPVNSVSGELLKVSYNIEKFNDEFKGITSYIWRHAQLNLLEIWIDNGVLKPQFIVLDPDYMLDISSLAACYRPHGAHAYNYILSKVQPVDNSASLLLGNIANHFLDEWIYATEKVDYKRSMQKVFRKYAIELASCKDLENPVSERLFFQDCLKHFRHIDQVVNRSFQSEGYKLDQSDAILEPSYICEALGIQGRLDYLQGDLSAFIEMKSGKADEFTMRGKVIPSQSHRVQMLLYQAVLYFNLNKSYKAIRAYLLYTRYPLLYPARSSWRQVQEVINLRNEIVANEFRIQFENSTEYTAALFGNIKPNTINTKNISGVLWDKYLKPAVERLHSSLGKLNSVALAYYFATYNFITKELYTSKSGDMDYGSKRGEAKLWGALLSEKLEEGTILLNLRILENRASDLKNPYILFQRDESKCTEFESLPNFRVGDLVVLYERNSKEDNVTNKLVFKGSIASISSEKITIRLRAAQRNDRIIDLDSSYAIEPDSMDTTYRNMFLGLDNFLRATSSRRDLILGKRHPEFDEKLYREALNKTEDLDRIVGKAVAAKDYFLLVGPPGTGKTSFALRRMVEEFSNRREQILLLAYTNQAVDEICKSITKIAGDFDYIRLGNELSCAPSYRGHLLGEVLSACKNRVEVKNRIQKCHVYVSTVASLAGKMDLFSLKQFDVAIVDEASQILESQLLGILTAKNRAGSSSAIRKFILIGDHKQLPAVVLQSEDASTVVSEELRELKIYNMRDALFERLYRLNYPQAKEILLRQGRMHPSLADFVNKKFYQNRLSSLNLKHQQEVEMPIPSVSIYPESPCTTLKNRVTFIESELDNSTESGKVNSSEAKIVAHLCSQIVAQYGVQFNSDTTIGVITPYRSQIALIKRELATYNIEELNTILVDTVERFQGSERDIIIYSFCVNNAYQLDLLCNILYDSGVEVDRKLNVALTRARKQIFLIGVAHILIKNRIYSALLNHIGYKS